MIRMCRKYFATHFAAAFTAVTGMVFLVILVSQFSYLEQGYQGFLMEQSYATENSVLLSIQQNMQTTIRELIAAGVQMAVDSEIYELAVKADQAAETYDENNYITMQLYNRLRLYDYTDSVVASAVVRKEGLLTQYDRLRSSDTQFWNEDTILKIEEVADDFWGEGKTSLFPRYLIYTDPDVHPGHAGCRVFHVAYPLTGGQISVWDTEYVLLITYNRDLLKEFVDTINMPKVEYIRGYVADRDGVILYHSDETLIGTVVETLLDTSECAHVAQEIGYFGWKIGAFIDEGLVNAHIRDIYLNGSAVYFLLFLVGASIIFIWFRRLMWPVYQLSDSMKRVEQGNLHSQIAIEGENELWQIAGEYNRMIEAIDQKNHEIELEHQETLRSIEQQHQAEREALESQINAHFICNTLGCINYEAIEGGNEMVSVLIKKLSNILRYTFDQKSQDVYMFQEIAWVDQYLFLQKSRLEDVFDYEVDFPDVYGQWPCCKLMFQPFVENSILHGFSGRENGGLIRIAGAMEGERLRIVIEDNGCGMDESTEKALQEMIQEKSRISLDRQSANDENEKRRGIGVRNVVTRMRMYYGSRLDIFLETEAGKGTRFVFLIPIPENYAGEEGEL